jgi:type IV secretion system protein VirB9
MRALLVGALILGATPAAAGTPTNASNDPRVRSVDYVADSVITVPVSPGVVTRVVLEHGEKIIAAATGVPSKCDNDAHQWCVVADNDANEVWIKPKAGARHNNLELKTDRRDYSFDLEVGPVTTYRVQLRYASAPQVNGAPKAPSNDEVVAARLAAAQPVAKNTNYSLESNQKGADITPKAVFDDGVFTYFKFPGNSELPTIFVIGSDGKEARTNYNMTGDYMVVQRLGRKFVLRLGKSVVSVWNESFDAQGIAPANGTTVAGVSRDTVEAYNAR